jgi:hypothetical protein
MQRTTLTILVLALGLALIAGTTHGAEIGHYAPGLANIRDLVMPQPGFYGVLYNYFYLSDRLNDGNGDEVNSVTINPRRGPGVTPRCGRGCGCLCPGASPPLGVAVEDFGC